MIVRRDCNRIAPIGCYAKCVSIKQLCKSLFYLIITIFTIFFICRRSEFVERLPNHKAETSNVVGTVERPVTPDNLLGFRQIEYLPLSRLVTAYSLNETDRLFGLGSVQPETLDVFVIRTAEQVNLSHCLVAREFIGLGQCVPTSEVSALSPVRHRQPY